MRLNVDDSLRQAGQNLTMIREQKGWTIQVLAVLSGVDENIIEGIESGKKDFYLSAVFGLAAALNVDFRQILVDPTDPRWQSPK